MAQNQQPQKSKWGVGSFLQQAVAGVESRLDLMLADSEDLPPKAAATKSKSNENVSQMAGSTVTKPRTPCKMTVASNVVPYSDESCSSLAQDLQCPKERSFTGTAGSSHGEVQRSRQRGFAVFASFIACADLVSGSQ